jgi:hypothetical protein
MQKLSFLTLITLIISLSAFSQSSIDADNQPYTWKNVRITGGGFVCGVVFHPNEEGLCYSRTDMGGAYRRNPETMVWEPLLDWLSYEDRNLMGVESIALDPNDPDWVFMACGTYTNPNTPDGAILWSNDRGKTFHRTDVPFKMGGNEDGRGNGERMAVDPNNGNIIYLGTRHAGLWKSTDRALSWSRVDSFPDITEIQETITPGQPGGTGLRRGSGIVFVIFDPSEGISGSGSRVIYAGVSLMNRESLFRSSDGGATWHPVPGQPVSLRPTQAVLASDGNMVITYGDSPGPSRMTDGAVWKLNAKTGVWTEITPDKPHPETRPFGYASVAVQKDNPNVLIVSTFHRYGIEKGDEIFRSTDGGKSWKAVFTEGGKYDDSLAPYTAFTGIHWLFDIEINPFNPDHAIFTTGYGGHETFNLTDLDKSNSTVWTIMSTGIEETVPLELLSPPEGAPLITAIGDYGGFVHWNLDQPSPEGNFNNPRFGNTNSIACAELKPEVIVRVGGATGNNPGQNIGYSLDGGRSWQPSPTLPFPGSQHGYVTVSSYGKTWIWSPASVRGRFGRGQNQAEQPQQPMVYYTTNNGESWNECKGLPSNTRIVADRVNPSRFYGMDLFGGKFFESNDGGVNFMEQKLNLPGELPQRGNRGDTRGGQDKIYTTPGHEGDLWIAAYDGLFNSSNQGKTFTKKDKVQEIHGFGFGKGPHDNSYPSLFIVGVVDGVRGIFRSDDHAQSFVRINDDQHQWGLILHITGDPKKHGRAYLGTHGRGALYGDPVKE